MSLSVGAILLGSLWGAPGERTRNRDIYGQVRPASGEAGLPAVVWVVLRGTGRNPYLERRLLSSDGSFRFKTPWRQGYTLSLESEGHRTSTLRLQSTTLPARHQVFPRLGARLDGGSPPDGPATVRSEHLKIPRRAVKALKKASRRKDEAPEQAVKELQSLVAQYPHFYQAWNNLGSLLAGLGLHTQATEALQQALLGSPDDPLLYRNLGFSHLLAGQWSEAERVFSSAAARWQTQAWAHAYLGEALYRQHRHVEAAAALRAALRNDSGFFHAAYYLGFTQVRLGNNSSALALFQDLLARSPDASRKEIRALIVRLKAKIAAAEAAHGTGERP